MRERNQLLDQYCQELGRDPETLDRSLYYWAPTTDADPWLSEQAFHEVIGPYVEAGMNQFLFDQPGDQQFGVLERIATGVIPKLVTEKPAPTFRPGVTVDTSHWRKPEDHLPD